MCIGMHLLGLILFVTFSFLDLIAYFFLQFEKCLNDDFYPTSLIHSVFYFLKILFALKIVSSYAWPILKNILIVFIHLKSYCQYFGMFSTFLISTS